MFLTLWAPLRLRLPLLATFWRIWIAPGVTFGVFRWIFEVHIIPDRSFYDHLVPFFQLQVHISLAFHENDLSFFQSVFLSSVVLSCVLSFSFSHFPMFLESGTCMSFFPLLLHLPTLLLCFFAVSRCIFACSMFWFSSSQSPVGFITQSLSVCLGLSKSV